MYRMTKIRILHTHTHTPHRSTEIAYLRILLFGLDPVQCVLGDYFLQDEVCWFAEIPTTNTP